VSDSIHDTLDELVEADYLKLKRGAFADMEPFPHSNSQAWHGAGYRHGYRDAIRHSSSVGAVMPLLRRIADALERE